MIKTYFKNQALLWLFILLRNCVLYLEFSKINSESPLKYSIISLNLSKDKKMYEEISYMLVLSAYI